MQEVSQVILATALRLSEADKRIVFAQTTEGFPALAIQREDGSLLVLRDN